MPLKQKQAQKTSYIKLNICAGSAKPAPPISVCLGQKRLNILEFCKKFNELTSNWSESEPLCVKIFVKDKNYELVICQPSVSRLVKKMLSLNKLSKLPGKQTVGALSKIDVLNLTNKKLNDTNSFEPKTAVKSILGSLKSMGIKVNLMGIL